MKEIDLIMGEIKKSIKINEKNSSKLMEEILNSKKIRVIGHGRSGYVAKSFSMRLKHLGFKIGPKEDLLIVISGSGETKDILKEVSKSRGKVFCITMNRKSSIGKLSDNVLLINAKKSKQPLRSLFEQSCLIYLDAIVLKIKNILNIKEKEMWKRHK